MKYMSIKMIALSFAAPLFFVQSAVAAENEIYLERGSNLAVQGYDVVAYFTEENAIKGSEEFEVEYLGATWRFWSQENLDTFDANPDAFRPEYGGYCAYQLARGGLTRGDARQWKVYQGKLYLNANFAVKRIWERKIDRDIERADGYWPEILNDK